MMIWGHGGMADTTDLKSVGGNLRVSSSLTGPTNLINIFYWRFYKKQPFGANMTIPYGIKEVPKCFYVKMMILIISRQSFIKDVREWSVMDGIPDVLKEWVLVL